MCGIALASDWDVFVDIMQRNSYRGQESHSVTYVDDSVTVERAMGPFSGVRRHSAALYIGHVQAPTQGRVGTDRVHPSCMKRFDGVDTYLWHNGVVKQSALPTSDMWDTKYIHEQLLYHGADALDVIDGSFACVMLHADVKEPVLFRNSACPLFVGNGCISSVKTPHTPESVNAGVVYRLVDGKLRVHTTFKSVCEPYYFKES